MSKTEKIAFILEQVGFPFSTEKKRRSPTDVLTEFANPESLFLCNHLNLQDTSYFENTTHVSICYEISYAVKCQLIVIFQVRLCLDRKDYMRAQILSRKISTRAFVIETGKDKKKPKEGDNVVVDPPPGVPSLLELKRIYYDLMIR
jgi:hypothetical protein